MADIALACGEPDRGRIAGLLVEPPAGLAACRADRQGQPGKLLDDTLLCSRDDGSESWRGRSAGGDRPYGSF